MVASCRGALCDPVMRQLSAPRNAREPIAEAADLRTSVSVRPVDVGFEL